jgi:hypothetical protein
MIFLVLAGKQTGARTRVARREGKGCVCVWAGRAGMDVLGVKLTLGIGFTPRWRSQPIRCNRGPLAKLGSNPPTELYLNASHIIQSAVHQTWERAGLGLGKPRLARSISLRYLGTQCCNGG